MKYKIYLRDWYYNAGVVGFLYVISDGENDIDKIVSKYGDVLQIGENFIEFNRYILNDFVEKYRKLAFIKLFDLKNYKERLDRLLMKIRESPDNKKIPKNLLQSSGINNSILKFVKDFCGASIEDIIKNEKETIINKLEIEVIDKLSRYNSTKDIYEDIKNTSSNFVDYILDIEISKKICNYETITEYIDKLSSDSFPNKKIREDKLCITCLTFNKEYDFSNAITQIIGFNKDNSNWVWGFESSKIMICPLCALIYACALYGMAMLKRSLEGHNKNFIYFLNRNTDIRSLYNSVMLFENKLMNENNNGKPFYTLINELVYMLLREKSSYYMENINFIEIIENDLGGQSTKSYNIFNYNISPELAKFILETDNKFIPTGWYKRNKIFIDIYDEILKKVVNHTLTYDDLNNYFNIFTKEECHFNIYSAMIFILRYQLYLRKGGSDMDDLNSIIKKAYANGCEIAQKIDNKNKLNGIVYQLLNDLKIKDQYAFIDKYTRLSISYDTPIKLGSNNELSDIDRFMQFGYAFINGLLSQKNINKEEDKNG